jgi:hypothetical protein
MDACEVKQEYPSANVRAHPADCPSIASCDHGGRLPGSRRQHGIGIVSMEERVRIVQVEFSIRSESGRGTTVSVFVPLAKDAS